MLADLIAFFLARLGRKSLSLFSRRASPPKHRVYVACIAKENYEILSSAEGNSLREGVIFCRVLRGIFFQRKTFFSKKEIIFYFYIFKRKKGRKLFSHEIRILVGRGFNRDPKLASEGTLRTPVQ